MYRYEVTVGPIFSSPAHNYFTRPKFEIGDAPHITHEQVFMQRGRGISGDRFERSRYPVTFFAAEVADLIAEAHGVTVDVALFRRNILIRGVNLNDLIAQQFRIGEVLFEGVSHCAPCPWMDAAIGKGTYALMKGRGGLRAKVIEGGTLYCGEQVLQCATSLESDLAASSFRRRLPRES